MPELPEVQTVVDELDTLFRGRSIIGVDIYTPSVIPFTDDDLDWLLNRSVSAVWRRCKYIVFDFEKTNDRLLGHLRMTGKFVSQPTENEVKHTHARFVLDNGDVIHYVDIRKFGGLKRIGAESLQTMPLGVEPLSSTFTTAHLSACVNGRNRPIKSFLMDQQFVCGLGNIYVDESLFRSRVHPLRPAQSLTDKECRSLVRSIKSILRSAITNMGTTLSDYRNTENISGQNQHYLMVYGQTGKPCRRCSTPIEKIKLGGRGTHFCPRCQIIDEDP